MDIREVVNSKAYWERRFSTGDWEERGGRTQTMSFATAQVRHFNLPMDFSGTILDFGCGLGDAIPVYRRFFPKAHFFGVDVSESAIEKCRGRYGAIATFAQGNHEQVPFSDVIVVSNVLEHLLNDKVIVQELLKKCKQLYVIVPYKEWPLCSEHIRTYDENYYHDLGPLEHTIFYSKGWSEYGGYLLKLKVKNVVRQLSGKPAVPRRRQIIFVFKGS